MTFSQILLFFVRLLAGTGVFLVGVHLLTGNIEQLATGKIKSRVTSKVNAFSSFSRITLLMAYLPQPLSKRRISLSMRFS